MPSLIGVAVLGAVLGSVLAARLTTTPAVPAPARTVRPSADE
ncbi:hypothetical protein ACIPW5_28720 [Streptomyces sp. NPDC090077]